MWSTNHPNYLNKTILQLQTIVCRTIEAELTLAPLDTYYNKTIEAITLRMPLGCMGESQCFAARMERSGALIYFGTANVERIGEHLGAVGKLKFDMLACVIETSGFLDLPDSGDSFSTAGETEIDLETTSGPRAISRDVLAVCPIFWAIETLCMSLLQNASWGSLSVFVGIVLIRWT